MSKIKTVFLYIFAVMTIAAAMIGAVSIDAGAGVHIGSYFGIMFFGGLFIVTLASGILKTALKKFYAPLAVIYYSGCALFFAVYVAFAIFVAVRTYPLPDDTDTVIVLGCQTLGYTPGVTLKSRLDKSLEVIADLDAVACITSGGQGPDETMPEGAAMKRYLADNGVASEILFSEEKSSNTFENLRLSKILADENSFELGKVVIITSEYHLPRALMIARRMGFDQVYGIGAPTPPEFFFVGAMREIFGFVKSFLFDK